MPAERDDRARLLEHIESADTWYRSLVNAMPDAVLIADERGRYLDANRAAVELLGHSVEALRGMTIADIVVNGSEWAEREFARLKREERWTGELDMIHRDGTRIPVEATSSIVNLHEGTAYVAVLRDVRERRRTREALARQEEEHRLIIENAVDYAIFSMDLERRVTSWNPGAERILGYTGSEILGRPADIIFTPDDRAAGAPDREVRQALERGRAEDVRWHVRSDGRWLWCIGVLSQLCVEGGQLRGFFKILRDGTPAKRAEDAMRQAHEELETRVRERTAELQATSEELSEFSYSVSHDLQAPLRAIHGYADTLREELGDRLDPQAGQHLARIVESASRMDALIRELLAYSQLGRIEMTHGMVAPASAVEDAMFQVQSEVHRSGARISIDVDQQLPLVRGHRPILSRALANLISNGIKFVAEGATPEVTVRAEERGDQVRFWVEDRGIGIAPGHHDRIFGVFERLHPLKSYAGLGVGLAMVRRSVERMGGQVGVESAPGDGSRFWIELPVARHADPEGSPEPS